jgi:chemotaxis protein MotB
MADGAAPVVIRRVKKVVGGGHHGGDWKVAFADFATAMMAFFLLLWLIAATTKEQKGAISEYFNNPSMMDGKATAPSQGMNGPGGASTSLIKLATGTNLKPTVIQPPPAKKLDAKELKKQAKELEKKRLESLMQDLHAAIEKSQALEPFKDQLLLDITPAGLRIQIVDKQNRPMFDLGGTALKPYTTEILRELGKFIETVPNRISISGHTDVTRYANPNGYTNWELSADRANAARRALLAGGLSEDKVAVVVGLSSSVLFDKDNPQAPINRRISIIVMNHDAEAAATGQDLKDPVDPALDGLPAGTEPDGEQAAAAGAVKAGEASAAEAPNGEAAAPGAPPPAERGAGEPARPAPAH